MADGAVRVDRRDGVGSRVAAARRDEAGAALILALVFVIVAALSLTALVTFSGTALLNTAHLKSQRALEYAATSATDIAIQAVRYRPRDFAPTTPDTTPNCLGPASVTFGGDAMAVDCTGVRSARLPLPGIGGSVVAGSTTVTSTTVFTGTLTFVGTEISDTARAIPSTPVTVIVAETNTAHTATMSAAATATVTSDTFTFVQPYQRTVTFSTCRTGQGTCTASNAIIEAVVAFDDSTATTGYACSSTTSQSCGVSMTIKQWTVETANH